MIAALAPGKDSHKRKTPAATGASLEMINQCQDYHAQWNSQDEAFRFARIALSVEEFLEWIFNAKGVQS